MLETVVILTEQGHISASPCFESFRFGKSFHLSDFFVQVNDGDIEGSILMVSSDPRVRLFSRTLLVGLLLSLAPSRVGSGFLRFFKKHILFNTHLNFFGGFNQSLRHRALEGPGS